jgi:integrase/recombinase XerD
MSHPSRVRVTGPLISFAEGFAAQLAKQGYRPNAAANQLQLLAHLSRWLATKGLDATTLTASALNEFLAARRARRVTRCGSHRRRWRHLSVTCVASASWCRKRKRR